MHRPKTATVSLLVAAFVLSGCISAAPRPYAPLLRPPPADPAAFERDFKACAADVAAGKRNFGQSGSAIVVGGVGGLAAVQVLGGVGAAASVGGGAMTALAASGVGLVMLVPMMTYGLSSSRRQRNEREIQTAMSECLAPSGYAVTAWSLAAPRDATATTPHTPTRSAPPPI